MSSTSSQYIYRLELTRPSLLEEGPTKYEASVLGEHSSYLENLVSESKVLLAGRTQDEESPFGIVIINNTTQENALAIMNNDPAVKNGVMRATLYPYKISVVSERITESMNNDD